MMIFVNIGIFLISLLCIVHGIYYNMIVTVLIGTVGALYALYMYRTSGNTSIVTEAELKEMLVKLEQEQATAVPEPAKLPVVEIVPVLTVAPAVVEAPVPVEKPEVKAKPPVPVITATKQPKKRGPKPKDKK